MYKLANYKRQSLLSWSIIILIGILTAALAASSQNLAPLEAPVSEAALRESSETKSKPIFLRFCLSKWKI
jgi:hypothetical protein